MSRPVRSPLRRLVRGLALGSAALLVVGAIALAVLRADDPVPRFEARRGTVAGATLDSVTREDGHLVQAVRVVSTSGLAVELLVKRPVDGARAPLVLILGGHNTGRDAARLIPDTRGRAVVALSYPYAGPHKLKGLAVVRHVPAIRRALLDTPPAIALALDWLATQPWVDTTRIDGVGASLGTPFMTVAAARDPRIGRLWSVHGAGDTRALLEHNARRYVPAALLPAAATVADILVAGPYLTPEKWIAAVAPRPVVMLNATEDEKLPRATVETLYDAAGAPKRLVWMPGRHVGRNRPEIVRPLVATVLAMMDSIPVPPVAAR
ncbi:MAG: hypothetical protein MUF40_04740 [Gemmatimonadaceae bacterium]|nr:hypothetical protein [Gemmatimonadaceae bacterium]